MINPNPNAVICVEHCSKSFNGVTVFDNVSFELLPGEIHCLCGENGAGKSTFIKILSGAYVPDSGEIYVSGKKVENFEPGVARALGVQTIYQNQFLMHNLSVAENIFMGDYGSKNIFVDYKKIAKKAKELLSDLEVEIDPRIQVCKLDVAQRQTVQIAKALAQEAKVLILDEPTASYGRKEKENLLKIVRKLADKGLGIIYISHHLDEVFHLADRATILRDGKKISCYKKEEIVEEKLISDMVGCGTSMFFSKEDIPKQEGKLEIVNLYKDRYVDKCSFSMQKGEIIGFGGMVGAGRTELITLIYGAEKADGGQVLLDGMNILPSCPSDAIKKGFALISEDRQKDGLFLGHSVGWNFISAIMSKTKSILINQKPASDKFMDYTHHLNIKSKGFGQKIQYLSGGNQQKVILAKWLNAEGEIYIFDEPTKGIDIGAKEDVYKLMTELAKQGKYIILVSSDMPELIAMSDRVYVMKDKRIVKELSGNEINDETILSYAIGG